MVEVGLSSDLTSWGLLLSGSTCEDPCISFTSRGLNGTAHAQCSAQATVSLVSLKHGTMSLLDDIEALLNDTNPLSVGTLIWVLWKLQIKDCTKRPGDKIHLIYPNPPVMRMIPSLAKVTMASNVGLVAALRFCALESVAGLKAK